MQAKQNFNRKFIRKKTTGDGTTQNKISTEAGKPTSLHSLSTATNSVNFSEL